MDKYRIVCRKYGDLGVSQTQEITAPWSEDGIYNITIRNSGVYEFIYLTFEGAIFNRSLYEIQSELAQPWNGVPTIRLPDVIIQQ